MNHNPEDALVRAVAGDARELRSLAQFSHEDLARAAAGLAPLIVTREAAIRILKDLRDARVAPESAQSWASFVRRGYVEAAGRRGKVRPVEIDYEQDSESAIIDAVSRLDEIGDVVDGVVSRTEIDGLLKRLT